MLVTGSQWDQEGALTLATITASATQLPHTFVRSSRAVALGLQHYSLCASTFVTGRFLIWMSNYKAVLASLHTAASTVWTLRCVFPHFLPSRPMGVGYTTFRPTRARGRPRGAITIVTAISMARTSRTKPRAVWHRGCVQASHTSAGLMFRHVNNFGN